MDLSFINSVIDKNAKLHMVYAGPLSQGLISEMTQMLEKEAQEASLSMTEATNLFTIFIELSQNIVSYAHRQTESYRIEGLLVVGQRQDSLDFFIQSQNLIRPEDRLRLEPKLREIKTMDKESIKKRYRELLRSGRDAHHKGAGIGFYEIAKRCDDIDYEFIPATSAQDVSPDAQVNFRFRARIASKKGQKTAA
jgi:hypothetical protein